MPLLSRSDRSNKKLAVIPFIELTILVVFACLPLILGIIWSEDDSFFWIVFSTKVMILGLFGLSFDLVWGYGGILSFGQALFFGGAGYVVAVLSRDFAVSSLFVVLPIAISVGLVLAALLAAFLLIGRKPPSLIFIALGSLTGSYVAERLARAWYYLGGQNGVSVTEVLTIGDQPLYEGTGFYYLVFGFLLVVYIGCRLLVRSQFGLVLAGARQREERTTFLGYQVHVSKAVMFTLGGAIAGLAGGLYAFHEGFLENYFIFGLHENYTSKKVFKTLEKESRIKYNTFEELYVRCEKGFDFEIKEAIDFVKPSKFGLEIDMDSIEGMPSSAITSSGLPLNTVREIIFKSKKAKNISYLHICEAAPIMENEREKNLVGKAIAYLVSDFIRK